MDNMPVTECIREFPLRQQYPSIIPTRKNKELSKIKVGTNLCLQSLISTKIKPLPRINVNMKGEFQKLRLKSPSGKDLGEFNAQVLPVNNIKGNSFLKQNKFKNFNKSVLLSNLMSKDNTKKLVTLVPIQSMKVKKDTVKLSKLTNIISSGKDDSIVDSKTCKPKTIFLKRITTNDQCHKEKQDVNTIVTDNCTNNECNKKGESECNQIQSTLVENGNNNDEIFNNKKKTLFLLPINNENNVDVYSKQKLPRFLKKHDDFIFSSKFVDILHDERNKKNISEYKKTLDQNMEADNRLSLDDYFKTNLNYNDPLVSIRHCKGNISVITRASDHENFTSQNINDDLSKNILDNNVPLPNELSSGWSILKEIASYIKEKEDKDEVIKDIKTLWNYITKKQSIPLHLSTEFKSLNAAKLQKDLLLDSTDENISDISKMKLKELYSANAMEKFYQQNNIYNNSPMSLFNEPQKSNEYLERFTKDICNKNSGANKVQKILSQTNKFHNKIFEQLKKDFVTVTQMDENGMLNIHKAVIHNRICDVHRYLMVLKACSISVDISTEFEMTSLELAIKHNVSTEIVKLLLEYGANPVSFKQIHESALIIASKKNYILLPELIKHVTSIELLNNVDCMGFAPLHYCAQNGNLKGIISLINMGADINLRENRFGRTALFLAMENKHPLIATKLIENGADIHIPNFAGQTVMPLGD